MTLSRECHPLEAGVQVARSRSGLVMRRARNSAFRNRPVGICLAEAARSSTFGVHELMDLGGIDQAGRQKWVGGHNALHREAPLERSRNDVCQWAAACPQTLATHSSDLRVFGYFDDVFRRVNLLSAPCGALDEG